MKGICITMVILLHCGFFKGELSIVNEYLKTFRVPLYFFLIGLFFKPNERFGTLAIKRINNLVIPYLFFSIILFIPHIIVNPYNQDICSWQYYFFGLIEPYNYPLWFLRCLFFIYILYYCLCKIITKIHFRIIVSFLISGIIWFITPIIKTSSHILTEWIFIHMNLLTALYVLPYIGIAEYFKMKGILSLQMSYTIKSIIFFSCILLLYIFKVNGVDLSQSLFGNNFISFYISSFAGITAVIIFAQSVKHLFYLSYIGRYSLIALGCHVMIIISIKGIFPFITEWQLSLVVLALTPIFIYIFSKIFPYFTAQKKLIKIPHDRQ